MKIELFLGTKIKVPPGREEGHSEEIMKRASSLNRVQEISGPENRKKALRVKAESEQLSVSQADVSLGAKVMYGIASYSSLAQTRKSATLVLLEGDKYCEKNT